MSWPTVPAAELMLKRGGSVNPANYPDETFELLSIPAFDKGEPEIVEGKEIGSSKSCVQPNDVLLSKIVPHIKRCWVVPAPQSTYRQIGSGEWIIFRSDKIHPPFLRHFLTSEIFHKQFMNTTAGVGGSLVRARPAEVGNIEIPLPPLPEQKRIAAILDKADAIRHKRQQTIQLADDFLRAVFLDMFGDPVTNPKGWEEMSLVSLVIGKFQNGAYFPQEGYSDDGVEMVHMSDAFYDVIQRGGLKRVLASDTDLKKYALTHEDLMISRRSLNYEGAAKPSMIPHSNEPLIFESSMIRITPDKSKVDLIYLFHYLSNPIVKDHCIRKFVTGATIKGISQKNLEQVTVLVPPLSFQRKFAGVVGKQSWTKASASESFEQSTEIFNAISQKAFRGEL